MRLVYQLCHCVCEYHIVPVLRSHYLVTIATYGDFEQLKLECANLIPNVSKQFFMKVYL